jgi:hypothetical protein
MSIHTPLPSTQFCNLDQYAKEDMYDKYSIPDLLTDDGPSTGLFTISCVVMQLTAILKTIAAFECIRQQRWELTEANGIFEYYHYLQLADTLKYIIKGIFICIIKEQCSNKGEDT